jgi:hypothetical protein
VTDLPGKEVQQWMRDAAREIAESDQSDLGNFATDEEIAQIIAAHVPSPTPEVVAYLVECRPKNGSSPWTWLAQPYKFERNARQNCGGKPEYEYRVRTLVVAK